MSYPNQKIVKIHKPKYKANFLQIGIDEWQQARRVMTYTEFALYLYIAGNADNFNLELSQKAVEEATGMKKTSYHDAVNKLTALGYLSQRQGNIYDFHTTPLRQSEHTRKNSDFRFDEQTYPPPRIVFAESADIPVRQTNREIDITDKKDIINKFSAKRKENAMTFEMIREAFGE